MYAICYVGMGKGGAKEVHAYESWEGRWPLGGSWRGGGLQAFCLLSFVLKVGFFSTKHELDGTQQLACIAG